MIWPFAFWSFSLVFPVVTCVDQARFPHFLFAPSPLQRAVFASPSPPHVFMCYLTWESERGPKHSRDCEVATRLATGSRQASSDDRKKKRRPCVRQMRFRSFIPIQFCAHLSGKPPSQFSPKKCASREKITSPPLHFTLRRSEFGARKRRQFPAIPPTHCTASAWCMNAPVLRLTISYNLQLRDFSSAADLSCG